jgi:hypothetical protein
MRGALFTLAIFCLISCKKPVETSEKKGISSNKSNNNEMICEDNSSATHSLCQELVENDKKINTQLNYILLRKSDGDTILRGSITSGSVKWLNEEAIEIFQTPGNISTELTQDDIIDIYIISENKKISKSEYLKRNK